jgi:cysteine desulfurase family protein (TIGR01976 family)
MTLDMQFVESQFPALRNREFVYLDNAGGSLVLQGVADRVRDYLLTASVQHGATYAKSQQAMERVSAATLSVMRLINAARPEEVVMGPSTTALLKILGTAIGERLSPGDEIIVSVSEHEANFGPWEKLGQRGIKILPWKIEPETYRLDPQRLKSMMTERTRLVCCTHASNILGTINPISEFADIAHAHGAKICVDAVAYAPHRLVDVRALDVDYYVFSFYKVYGPHHAVLYGRYDDLVALPGQNHFFIEPTRTPYKFQPGNVNYELAYGCIGINEYLVELASRSGRNFENERGALQAAFELITRQEEAVCTRLLDFLNQVRGVRIIGEKTADAALRVPTISFTVADRSSREIVSAIDRHGLGIRHGDFYARRLSDHLGLDPADGVVRISMVHYNTVAEIESLITHLEPLLV